MRRDAAAWSTENVRARICVCVDRVIRKAVSCESAATFAAVRLCGGSRGGVLMLVLVGKTYLEETGGETGGHGCGVWGERDGEGERRERVCGEREMMSVATTDLRIRAAAAAAAPATISPLSLSAQTPSQPQRLAASAISSCWSWLPCLPRPRAAQQSQFSAPTDRFRMCAVSHCIGREGGSKAELNIAEDAPRYAPTLAGRSPPTTLSAASDKYGLTHAFTCCSCSWFDPAEALMRGPLLQVQGVGEPTGANQTEPWRQLKRLPFELANLAGFRIRPLENRGGSKSSNFNSWPGLKLRQRLRRG